jgi:DNA helicase-4
VLRAGSTEYKGSVLALEKLRIEQGTIWSTVTIPLREGLELALDGIPNSSAQEMVSAVAAAAKTVRVGQLLRNFGELIAPIAAWSVKARDACLAQIKSKGWLTHEFKTALNLVKPAGFPELLTEPELESHLKRQPREIQDAVGLWKQDFTEVADGINERHLGKELKESRPFFDRVEKSPLTDEQAKAVICFDNRVLLVASAGSGKTSTMVAKAGYALEKGYYDAEKILLLAFNNDAAAELRERIKARLEPLGLPASKVVAKTFHAFSLDIIGTATGRRPSLAPWVESGRDLETLMAIVDELKDSNARFRTDWDMFRLVMGQDLPEFGKESESPEAWNSDTRSAGFWTLNNDVVKSRGEQLIANWLFYNGVSYIYEAPYKHDTADAAHRQYRPDFYLPDVDAYLEHWALDENGDPPSEFTGYKESMAWKKNLHAENGTTLLETTMAELWSGKAFGYLTEELTKRGITLDPNPERPIPGRKPIENPRLARTFRSFLTHVKSNQMTVAGLLERVQTGAAGHFRFRHSMFLRLFEQIWKAWEAKLTKGQCIDFEDMLNLAADYIEQRKWANPYELIMVDEFQDVSQARARLMGNLVKNPGSSLFAVGDDWQSINRFAGADLAVMTNFEARFGRAVTLRLETTFRCPQSICDISSSFIQKNPMQIRKRVRTDKPDVAHPLRIIRVDEETKIRAAIAKCIQEIAERMSYKVEKTRVYILGRYNSDRAYEPPNFDQPRLEVKFITVHTSKGLEADHIILPRVTSDTLGFPSRVADDPVLQLAMPGGDSFENAEERRLFYVALTRARLSVTLITVAHRESPFIVELVKDHAIEIADIDGSESRSEVCPTCREGFLVKKVGRYGSFFGCSRFPKCSFTRNIADEKRRHRSNPLPPNAARNSRGTPRGRTRS